jgi:hypothetical protein
MKGLFANESPLNCSFHEGKDTRRTQYEDTKLLLLGKLGK